MQPDPSQNNVLVQTVLCSRSATTHEQFVFQQRPTNTRKAQIAERFVESVLALWHVSAISSEVACTMFWWTGKVGLQGDVPRLALRFGRRRENYKRHLEICLGHAKGRQLHFLLPVPSHKRHDLTRSVHDVPTMPKHDVLAKGLRDSATVPFKLEEARENGTLPRACWDHPVAAPLCCQWRFLWTASPTATQIVSWACGHVVSLIRKRQMCKCGCQGWCSQFSLMTLLRWSLKAMADGRCMCGRHLDISRQFCSNACLGKSIL